MKVIMFTLMAAAAGGINALATRIPPFHCDFVCIEPSQPDPNAAGTCNCAEKYCPTHQGPGGPNIPSGDVWAWNQATDACGAVPKGSECAGLDVTCIPHYTYRWNGVDTCQCLPQTKRDDDIGPVCDIACVLPRAYDPHAVSPNCNCAERVCPPGPECPSYTSFGWDEDAGACGCVVDQEEECVETDTTCVAGFRYGWDAAKTRCKCVA